MTRQEAIAAIMQDTKDYASFVSEKYIDSLLPEKRKSFWTDEICHFEEILSHEIKCLKEFIELANDQLLDMTQSEEFSIVIAHNGL